jgi:hypothetical protein
MQRAGQPAGRVTPASEHSAECSHLIQASSRAALAKFDRNRCGRRLGFECRRHLARSPMDCHDDQCRSMAIKGAGEPMTGDPEV